MVLIAEEIVEDLCDGVIVESVFRYRGSPLQNHRQVIFVFRFLDEKQK